MSGEVKFDLSDPYGNCDHVIGGVWGHHIRASDGLAIPEDIVDGLIGIWGHLPWENRIKIGQTIVHEYERNWFIFEVVEVDWKYDPRDMFSGKIRVLRAYDKLTGDCSYNRDDWLDGDEVGLPARIANWFSQMWHHIDKAEGRS